jgi:hypothetical protein
MMLVVLLLGAFITTSPDLDDDDDNVGCAAVLPVSVRKSAIEVVKDEGHLRRGARASEVRSTTVSAVPSMEAVAPATVVMSQVTPPLRP